MAFISRDQRLDHLIKGGVINDLDVKTNLFNISFPRESIHHYDVGKDAVSCDLALLEAQVAKVITPLYQTSRELGSKKKNELVQRTQSDNSDIFRSRAAFDGQKNLFAPTKYFSSQSFEVELNMNEKPRPGRELRKVRVDMKHVNSIDFGVVHQYLQTQQSNRLQDSVNLVTNMLNVFMSAVPKQKAGVLTTSKSIFVQESQKQPDHEISPLQLWRGYYQSVRPAFDRMVVNVDVTIGVILPADKLEYICADYLRVKNLQDLRHLRPDMFQKLRHFLKSVKVTVELEAHKHKSSRAIKDLILDGSGSTFEKDGKMITVAKHFELAHNVTVPPRTLGVKFERSSSVFPITVCRTVQQFYKNRATPEVVRAALRFTPESPSKREEEVRKAFGHLSYGQSFFLSFAGINVDEQPQTIKGRLLPRPDIVFRNDVRRSLNARPGVWDVMSQRLVKPAIIQTWVLINFVQIDDQSLHYFIDELIGAMNSLGIQVSAPVAVENKSVQTNIERELANLMRQYNPTFILAILPDPAEEQYRKIKRFGDITQGVATQCVRWSNNLRKNVGQRRVNQYQNNLILKINPKMGGENFHVESPVFKLAAMQLFMVIGADVSHPGPGSQMPSVASLVASFDEKACRYVASVRVQSSRVEIIEEYEAMFQELLEIFVQRNKQPPKLIFIFRDGVSEGEFLTVEASERQALCAVFQKAGYSPKQMPQILYVVVGKRHHIRFFPGSRGADPRGNGNFPSGLVVDDSIVHPRFCDFYLQSQPGLKGTSIPSHYTVLRNDRGIPLADIQKFAYDLCHCYSRSTRSVKIPAPVYYADLVCRRAKFHFSEEINDYSSTAASDDVVAHLDYFRSKFHPVNTNMRYRMYYV